MAFRRPHARILERTTTAGNGPYALAGAVDGSYRPFSAFMSVGDVTEGYVVEPGVAFWTGILTYSAANQVTLTTVEETNGTFGSGTKEIGCGPMAAKSAFPQDIAGAIVTGGTSTAYTVASYRVYDTLTRLDGNLIAFTPHATNGATVTLNVDGLGNKPLRPSPGVELQSNVLIQGTPYLALYNHSDDVFYLHGMGGNTYGVPLGCGLDCWGPTTPSSAFIFPTGQALDRTAYAAFFNLVGTTYGSGNGTTTFNAPDKAGRASIMKEATATRVTSAVSGIDGATLGSAGGSQSDTLTAAQIPNITMPSTSTAGSVAYSLAGASISGAGPQNYINAGLGSGGSNVSVPITVPANTSNNTGGGAHPNVQPGIICNYAIRVL